MLFVTGAMTDCTPIQKKVEEKFVETATFLAVILNYIKSLSEMVMQLVFFSSYVILFSLQSGRT